MICAKPSSSCRAPAAIAGSSTSTLDLPEPRSAVHLAAKRKPAAAARCLEGLYAAGHQHDQFFAGIAARAGHPLRSVARRARRLELGLTGSIARDSGASRVPEDWGHGFAGSCALADAAAHARF